MFNTYKHIFCGIFDRSMNVWLSAKLEETFAKRQLRPRYSIDFPFSASVNDGWFNAFTSQASGNTLSIVSFKQATISSLWNDVYLEKQITLFSFFNFLSLDFELHILTLFVCFFFVKSSILSTCYCSFFTIFIC